MTAEPDETESEGLLAVASPSAAHLAALRRRLVARASESGLLDIAYRFIEDYLLTPRVMRHTVRISPGLTIIATLIGGTLLGLIGALVAIPTAAAVYLLLEEVVFPRMNRS